MSPPMIKSLLDYAVQHHEYDLARHFLIEKQFTTKGYQNKLTARDDYTW